MTSSITDFLILDYFAVSLSSYITLVFYTCTWAIFLKMAHVFKKMSKIGFRDMSVRWNDAAKKGNWDKFLFLFCNGLIIFEPEQSISYKTAHASGEDRSACASAQADPSLCRTPWITKDPKRSSAKTDQLAQIRRSARWLWPACIGKKMLCTGILKGHNHSSQ